MKKDIIEWWANGLNLGFTHMMVICDTNEREDYPVYTNEPKKERHEIELDPQMRKIIEVYSYKLNFITQLNERRAIHYE
jgi:hypothetical protein